MARDIFIIDQQLSAAGETILRGVFWIATPGNLVKKSKTTRSSQVPDVTVPEQADIDNGLVAEVSFDTGAYPLSFNQQQMLDDLKQRKSDLTAAFLAKNPPLKAIGLSHDTVTDKWT